MNPYYLMAQLPSLDGLSDGMTPPITKERYLELCRRFLGKRALRALETLTLTPPREQERSGSALLDAWYDAERSLRMALGLARAQRRQVPFNGEVPDGIAPETEQVVRAAVAQEDPLEAERLLNRYRLQCLENLRPADAFCEDSVFYYGLKLMLLLHIRQFDPDAGVAAYRMIYTSILEEERAEVIQ